MRFAVPVILVLVACARGDTRDSVAAAADNRSFGVDDFQDTIKLSSIPKRIVSLNPTTTEVLFALGVGSRLVGRTQYDNWPDSARFVPNLGPGIRPNVEAVLAAKPDLVLLYASQDNRAAAERFHRAGIATAAFKVDRIEQFDRLTRLLGRLIGDSARGALVADTVKRTLDSVRIVTRALPRVTAVLPTWDQPLIVIGGGSFMSELVTIAGGRNVYDSVASPSPTVSIEDIVRRDPQVILVGPESAERVRAAQKWRAVRAAREGRLYIVDTALVLRPAVRLGEGAVSLARLLHPELARR
ncbi:MAG TPA: helical backbone metal receptor [Gemmatimonadaceae bacterium]|nr:helical backbone metal receptor [Gemmatimonadaceae bacterium]